MTPHLHLDPHEPLIRAPRLLTRWYVWALGVVVLLAPFFITIPLKLRKHPVIGPLGDQVHVPLLGAIMLLAYWKGPLRGRLYRSALAAAVVGGLIEFIQLFVGRSALFTDWLRDLVGIGIVTGFVLWRGLGSRRGLTLMVALILTIPWTLRKIPKVIQGRNYAAQHFPVLDDFEYPGLQILWDNVNESEITFTRVEDGPSGPTGVLAISGVPPSTWPGARMIHFPFDWTAYSRVMVRARHAGPDTMPVKFAMVVDDFAGRKQDARFSQAFWSTGQWQTFALPLKGRKADHCDHVIDLGDIETLYIILPGLKDTATLEVDAVWLE